MAVVSSGIFSYHRILKTPLASSIWEQNAMIHASCVGTFVLNLLYIPTYTIIGYQKSMAIKRIGHSYTEVIYPLFIKRASLNKRSKDYLSISLKTYLTFQNNCMVFSIHDPESINSHWNTNLNCSIKTSWFLIIEMAAYTGSNH